MAKQNATARPGTPMSRNSFSVPRKPSRQTMKPSRKAAAQNERQNTTVQLSGVSMKRAMAPPKLQTDRRQEDEQEADALVARRDVADARRHGLFARLTHDVYSRQSVAAGNSPAVNPSALFNAVLSGVVQPRNPVVANASAPIGTTDHQSRANL